MDHLVSAPTLLFEHARALVYCGRWQDLGLGPDSVDCTISDPPYLQHIHQNVRSCDTNGPVRVKQFDIKFDPLTEYSHVPALLSITKRWVVLFCALEQLGAYQDAAGGPRARLDTETAADYRARLAGHVRSGIWRKKQAAPQLSGDRPANSCEGFTVLHKRGGQMSWNGSGKHAYLSSHEDDANAPFYAPPDFIEEGRERAEKRHGAQKPAALCARLAEWFVKDTTHPVQGANCKVNADEIVFDPYCGSGALGMAALDRGATVIFVDSDPEWAQFTADRVARYLSA